MKYVDYYAALGLPRDADLAQIKKAYRTQARLHHPDVSKAPGAEEKFKNVAAAYATLKNPEKRAAYDALGLQKEGAEMAPPTEGMQGWSSGAGNSGDQWNFEGMDLSDFLSAMGQGRRDRPRRGHDMEDSILVELKDVLRGTTLHLTLTDAGGTRDLEVKLPAGMRAGQTLRLRGKGGKGTQGAPDGDFLLHITYAPHAIFRVNAQDLLFDLALSPWEATLGAEVTVPTLDADVVLSVPAGTSSGKKLRLRGRGLPDGAGPAAGRGDLYAVVQIKVPDTLTAEEKSLMEQLARHSTFTPRKTSPGAPHATPAP